jgi:TRAP-type C4-dicarboxylate transport system permease small subunit
LATLGTVLYRFLYGAFFAKDTLLFNFSYLLSLIVWTVAQGGLGACAFLGTRIATRRSEKFAVDTLVDVTDVTDESILRIRIVLGCLFGSLIGVPIGSLAFDKMGNAIYDSTLSLSPSDMALIVLPFMVGFSTNLVLAILERFVDSIKTFFGMSAK